MQPQDLSRLIDDALARHCPNENEIVYVDTIVEDILASVCEDDGVDPQDLRLRVMSRGIGHGAMRW